MAVNSAIATIVLLNTSKLLTILLAWYKREDSLCLQAHNVMDVT